MIIGGVAEMLVLAVPSDDGKIAENTYFFQTIRPLDFIIKILQEDKRQDKENRHVMCLGIFLIYKPQHENRIVTKQTV